jgi:hypothetical protein
MHPDEDLAWCVLRLSHVELDGSQRPTLVYFPGDRDIPNSTIESKEYWTLKQVFPSQLPPLSCVLDVAESCAEGLDFLLRENNGSISLMNSTNAGLKSPSLENQKILLFRVFCFAVTALVHLICHTFCERLTFSPFHYL